MIRKDIRTAFLVLIALFMTTISALAAHGSANGEEKVAFNAG
ncbi:MAG: hypothetical protein ACI8UQ_000411, partial [Bacteroidia bacterium]